jgi:iron(III) transport system permease protein
MGRFKGDLFVAAAVIGCRAALDGGVHPVPGAQGPSSAFLAEDGGLSLAGDGWERVASERNFGLQCLAGGGALRRGMGDTLFHRPAHGLRHHHLGTMMALMAGAHRQALRPGAERVVAMLPIITPPVRGRPSA